MAQQPDETQTAGTEEEAAARHEDFVLACNRLFQTARIHEADNQLSVKAGEKWIASAKRILAKDPEIIIEARHERIFLQGNKLLLKQHTAAGIFGLLGWFDSLGLYGLQFRAPAAEVTPRQACELARTITAGQTADNPLEYLQENLSGGSFPWVELILEPQSSGGVSYSGKNEIAHQAYSHAYNSIKEVVREIQTNDKAGVRKAVRVIQDITDMVFMDKSILLGISTIRDYDDYTFTHSVNVAIQSVCLGHEIGLSRNSLVRLGICGLFHDLGKVVIPHEIINKPGHLNQKEFHEIKQHPINSVRQILKLEAYRDLIAQILLPPFEHHLNYDLSGYPEVPWSRSISLFGRIIEICDVYDALSAPRVYRDKALSQDRVLGLMFSNSGKKFDPVLLKWFINMVGIYPVGTLVKLSSGEVGLIYQSRDDSGEQGMPLVLLLRKKQGGKLSADRILDLNARDKKTGKYLRSVKSTHNPYEYGIQPAVYLMQAE